ncbi:helix-turn-helix domain-containing protein [Candidatus Micrarchaeota archaeon]|nr:helix-turn-helix domain-containing protein [Candidatus Micrarchaeota archaeon]
MDKLKLRIAGEISLSEDPGSTMKKWREIFGITQGELAKEIGISVSTISDYESNRRKSPGATIIKRFVTVLFELDAKKGGGITQKLLEGGSNTDEYFEQHEFARSLPLSDFIGLVEGTVVTNPDLIEERKLYGYTLIDSIKVILDMPFTYFTNIYGNMNERAMIFTGVSTGRSPMVVIRVSPSKPSVVILHGIKKVDKLAIKLSEKEQIPIVVTQLDISEIKERLNKI